MQGLSPFTEGERELVAAYVSRLNHCHFCEGSHTAGTVLYGYDEKVIEQLVLDLTHASIAERLKPVFRYVRKPTLRPDQVAQADVTAMYEAGWDETAVTHAALVCAYFSFMNRWVDGSGIPSDPAVVQIAADMLRQKGYAAVIELLDRAREPGWPEGTHGAQESMHSSKVHAGMEAPPGAMADEQHESWAIP